MSELYITDTNAYNYAHINTLGRMLTILHQERDRDMLWHSSELMFTVTV